MLWQHLSLSIILILASALELGVVREAWKRRSISGVYAFALMNLAGAVWCLGTAFELSSPDIPSVNFWLKFEFVGITNVSPLWLLFALGYTGQARWLPRRYLALLWVIPVICLGMALTNDWHGLFWSNFQAPTASVPYFTYTLGPFLYVTAIYTYLLLFAGSFAFIYAIARYPRVYRRQAILMLAGILFPWIASLSFIAGLTPGLDFSPLAISISGAIFSWSISRYGFLDVIPVARDILIENMMDGLLVIDAQNHTVDINPTAQKLLGTGSQPVIGKNLKEVFNQWADVDRLQGMTGEGTLEISSLSLPPRYLDLHISTLNDRRNHIAGRLIVLRDITEQKKVAQDEREQRVLAETLKESIAALNSTLNFDEILDLILRYIERVVPHDAASIGLIDKQGMVRIKRARGYKERNLEDYVLSVNIPVNMFPNWQWLFESGKAMVAADTQREPGWVILPETSWIRSYAAAPITIKGKVIGVINLDSATPGFFTSVHARRLQAFADQAAVAIEKAQLFAEAARRAELMETINQIGIALTSGRDLEKILKTMHEQVQLAAPTDVFYIALYDEKTGEISFPLWFEDQKYYQVPERSIHQTASLTGYVIQTRKTIYFEDTLTPDFKPPAPLIRSAGRPARSYICVPMLLGDQVIGVISLQNYQPNVYSTDQVHLLETVATQASIAIENARLFAQMEQMATIDPVTELYNRRQFILLTSREVERSLRYGMNLSAMMIDIDHFKKVNDTYGHAMGDQALYAIARLCKQTLRSIDVVGRYGGDEYALILPETDQESARLVAERLRQNVDGLEIRLDNKVIHITVSIGVASLKETKKNLEFLLACTDQALYAAKQDGRNMVRVYLLPDPQLPG